MLHISLETILKFIQFFSILTSGIFGILALLVNYKDESTKKITIWGKIAIFGVVFSTILGASSLAINTSIEEKKSKIQFERYMSTIEWFHRVSTPLKIKSIKLIYKTNKNLKYLIDDKGAYQKYDFEQYFSEIPERTTIELLLLHDKSELLSYKSEGGVNYDPTPKRYSMQTSFQLPQKDDITIHGIEYDTRGKINKKDINYLSFLDLPSKRLIIKIDNQFDYTTLALSEIHSLYKMEYVLLEIGEIAIKIESDKFSIINGFQYEYIFPETVEELFELI